MGQDSERQVFWMRGAGDDLRKLPVDVQDAILQSVEEFRLGGYPESAKPFHGVGGGVYEIVEDEDTDTYRAVVAICFPRAVYVLHVFKKKSKRGMKTPKQDVEMVKRRLDAARADYRERYG
jgi:phage-related protein